MSTMKGTMFSAFPASLISFPGRPASLGSVPKMFLALLSSPSSLLPSACPSSGKPLLLVTLAWLDRFPVMLLLRLAVSSRSLPMLVPH